LPRPVPNEGEVRLLIDKTYLDPKSYTTDGDVVTFSRSLGIKRNAVVLPNGYEVIACNYPSQLRTEEDGRISVSFINIGPAEVPYVVKARKLGAAAVRSAPDGKPEMASSGTPAAVAP